MRSLHKVVLIFSGIFLSIGSAFSQTDWPTRPITIVVPFPVGGQTDVVARIIADKAGKELGQSIIVDNKPGVNGSLGSEVVARSAPDGYTLVAAGPGSHGINQLVNPNVKYDARKDFTNIASVAKTTLVLLASPSFKGNSVKDLVSYAKSHPGELTFATTGIGSSGFMSMHLLKQATGIDFTMIPYKGDAPAITDMMGGQVNLLFINSAAAVPQVKSGKLRALAVTGKSRNPSLPDVPTMIESGYPSVVVESWVGISGPAKIPEPIVTKLNKAVNNALATTEVKGRLFALGMVPAPGTPAEYQNYLSDEVAKWSAVVKAGNIRTE